MTKNKLYGRKTTGDFNPFLGELNLELCLTVTCFVKYHSFWVHQFHIMIVYIESVIAC